MDDSIPFASLTAISQESYGLVVAGADKTVLFQYQSFLEDTAAYSQTPSPLRCFLC